MIKQYSLTVLQKAVNHALSLDESMPAKIQALHGKVLEIIISPLNVGFFMRFMQNELLLLADYDALPDAIIRSSPLGLIRLSLLPASKVRSLFNDKIRISGDVELGQQVKKQFSESMRRDVTEYLQEELRAFPPREEVNDFFNDIDELSLRVERLAAHVNQLLESSK